jgi:predicted nuclease with TOPRIM domain
MDGSREILTRLERIEDKIDRIDERLRNSEISNAALRARVDALENDVRSLKIADRLVALFAAMISALLTGISSLFHPRP